MAKTSGLVKVMKARGTSLREVAGKIGMGESNLTMRLNGTSKLYKDVAVKVSEASGISMDEISLLVPVFASGSRYKKRKKECIDFDTESKVTTRKLISKHIETGSKIFTLPSSQGMCVKEFLETGVKPEDIDCVDRDKETFLAYKKKKYGTNDFLMSAEDFLEHTDRTYDIEYLDFCGTLYTENARAILEGVKHLKVDGILGVTVMAYSRQEKIKGKVKQRFIKILNKTGRKFEFVDELKYQDKRTPMEFYTVKLGRKKLFGIF